ncbi:hypothetical protein ES703_110679 [subsurface metagenome]
MEKAEIEKAAMRLGIRKETRFQQILKTIGIIAIAFSAVLFVVALLIFLGKRLDSTTPGTYPHLRTLKVPRNRLFTMLLFISDEVKYGVFCRLEQSS